MQKLQIAKVIVKHHGKSVYSASYQPGQDCTDFLDLAPQMSGGH